MERDKRTQKTETEWKSKTNDDVGGNSLVSREVTVVKILQCYSYLFGG